MTKLIICLFVRDYKNTESPAVRTAYGRVAGMVGIITNLILAAAKLLVGFLSGSIAIISDAVNNLTDSGSSVITMIGFKMAARPPDKKHPYGYARMEYISGLIASVVILFLGLELGKTSLERAIHPEKAEFNLFMIGVLVGSILVKLWQCLFYYKMGKTISSVALKANSTDSRNDMISTAVVLAGILFTHFTGYNVDGYAGMAVAIFIIISGIQLIIETTGPLLGNAPSRRMVRQLQAVFDGSPQVLGYHDLQIHDYGTGIYYATVHFEMDSRLPLEESHRILDKIERQVRSELGVELVVHLDPVAVDDKAFHQIHGEIEKMIQEVSPVLEMHDLQIEWTKPLRISFDLVAPFRFAVEDTILREEITKNLQKRYKDCQVEILIDHNDALMKEEQDEEEA